MKKKILVQFDGSNFYKKVKRILPQVHLTNFDYAGLAHSLDKDRSAQVIYYVGEIRKYPGNKKSQSLYANQQKLFTNLRNQNIEIKLGYLLFSDGKFNEKGVDVQIAVDQVRGAIKNEYDKCFLISSDTDLLPAIQTAKDEKKEIIYVGFENFISRALQKNCSSYLILKRDQILRFTKVKKVDVLYYAFFRPNKYAYSEFRPSDKNNSKRFVSLFKVLTGSLKGNSQKFPKDDFERPQEVGGRRSPNCTWGQAAG